jgi:hypothetical protein
VTHEAWDVPARQAFRELEAWRHKWRGIDGGDGARLSGMLARMLIRAVPEAKLGTLRVALAALIDDRLRGNLDAEQLEQAAGNFVELLQERPAPKSPLPPARVVLAPWRCRWFGHAWRNGNARLGGPVLFCERAGCVEERHWPPYPRPGAAQPPGFVVGVAGEAVLGGLVSVRLDGKFEPVDDEPAAAAGWEHVCGRYREKGSPSCRLALGHFGRCDWDVAPDSEP